MTKHKLKTALYVFSTVAIALSFIAPSVAQSRQYGQQTSPLVDLIGTIAKASAKSNAKKKWSKVSPEIQQCVNTYLASRKISVDQMITEGLSPDHEKVTPIVTMCQSVMAAQLKANFPCNITNSKGLQVATTCVQSYAKAVSGKWAPISRDDFLRAGSNNEQVTIADFETQAAQNTRLAEEKRIAQEAAAKAEAARLERLAKEEATRIAQEEERLRFAASPAGKRQAAEQAARERAAAAEARRKPRGYEMVCNAAFRSQRKRYNLYMVNCNSKESVSSALRWAHNMLSAQPWFEGGAFAESCVTGLMNYLREYNEYTKNGWAISDVIVQGNFAGCNNGLWFVRGPSAEQAARGKR